MSESLFIFRRLFASRLKADIWGYFVCLERIKWKGLREWERKARQDLEPER